MSTSTAPPGWHPDPSNPAGALRWWDGGAWTTHTHQPQVIAPPVMAAPAPAWQAASSTITPNYGSYGGGTSASGKLSFAKQNSISLTAIGVVVLYVALAMTTRVVLLGVFPVLMSVRAMRAKEVLAPAAVVAAVVAVGVAFLALR